jgi:hypothetical protein
VNTDQIFADHTIRSDPSSLTDRNRGVDLTANDDTWINNGIQTVAEPSSIALIVLGGTLVGCFGRARLRNAPTGSRPERSRLAESEGRRGQDSIERLIILRGRRSPRSRTPRLDVWGLRFIDLSGVEGSEPLARSACGGGEFRSDPPAYHPEISPREPFRAFRLDMASDRTFDVRHPEMARLNRSSLTVFSDSDLDPDLAIEDWEDVSLMLMESISHPGRGGRS